MSSSESFPPSSSDDAAAQRPLPSPQDPSPDPPLYREKLTPSFGVWLLVLVFGLSSFAVVAPINLVVGVLVGVLAAGALGLSLYSSAPVIEVTEERLQVGRASIEREFVGTVEIFRGEAVRVAAGPDMDGRAYMNFRPWVSPLARLEITDPADPTPYWLTNTRHPEALAAALGCDPVQAAQRGLNAPRRHETTAVEQAQTEDGQS